MDRVGCGVWGVGCRVEGGGGVSSWGGGGGLNGWRGTWL